MRICCVISSLGLGGAQRVMVAICSAWAARGDRVTLITLARAETDFFTLDARIERIALDVLGESSNPFASLWHSVGRAAAIRRAILDARPEVVLSFLDVTNVLTLIATRGSALPVVVGERTYPGASAIGRWRNILRRIAYGWAIQVVAQTEDTARWLQRHTRARQVTTISNFLAPEFHAASIMGERQARVLAVGRLGREKGFDLLLLAWSKVGPERVGWRLRIVGEGPERAVLQRLARDLGIEAEVEFPGQMREVAAEYASARIFVLSSRFEGFPNALIEASASGCACIAFDCLTGPREIFAKLVTGTLVEPEDVDGLARALSASMATGLEASARSRLASATRSSFSFEAGLAQWDRVIGRI